MDNNLLKINDDLFLCQLIVGIGEVAEITGIPIRQLRYWEEKGIIKSLTEQEGKNRRYDYVNIKKALLIKIHLEEGFTLEGANTKVSKQMSDMEGIFKRLKQAAIKPEDDNQ